MTAPVVCAPVGSLALDQVEGFPPAAARHLADRNPPVRTLADLEPYVEAVSDRPNDAGAVRKAFRMLDLPDSHLDQATFSLLFHLRPAAPPEPPAAKKPSRKKKASPAAEKRTNTDSDANRALQDLLTNSHVIDCLGDGACNVDPAPCRKPRGECSFSWDEAVQRWRSAGISDAALLEAIRQAFKLTGQSDVQSRMPRTGIMWSARSRASDRLEWRYGCGPGEPPTLAGDDLVATVRLLFAIPQPGEIHETTGRHDGTGTPRPDDAVSGRDEGATAEGNGVHGAVLAGGQPSDQPVREQLPATGDDRGTSGSGGPAGKAAGRSSVATDDFDENTPPPRSRPIGDPAPRYVELPPGESAAQLYQHWDSHGRIPAGSVLLKFIGTDMGQAKHGGYEVVASGFVAGQKKPPLGSVQSKPSAADLEPWRIIARIYETRPLRTYVVMEGPR